MGGGEQGLRKADLLFGGSFHLPKLLRSPLVDILLHSQKVKLRRDLPPYFTHQSSTVLPVFSYAHPSAHGRESYWIRPCCSRPGLEKPHRMEMAQLLRAAWPRGSAHSYTGKGQSKLSKHCFFKKKGEQAVRNKNNLLITVCTGNSKMKQRSRSQDIWTISAFKNIIFSPGVWNGFRQNLHT